MQGIPENALTLEEAAAHVGVAPHVILFWQARGCGFRTVDAPNGSLYIRRGDLSLLCALQRLLSLGGHSISDLSESVKRAGASSIITETDRVAARTKPPLSKVSVFAPDNVNDNFVPDLKKTSASAQEAPNSLVKGLQEAVSNLQALRSDLVEVEHKLSTKESSKVPV